MVVYTSKCVCIYISVLLYTRYNIIYISQARIQDFLKGGGWKTFTSTPPWTLPVWRHQHSKGGGGWSVPVKHTLHRFSGSGQARGGGGWSPLSPPPLDPTLSVTGADTRFLTSTPPPPWALSAWRHPPSEYWKRPPLLDIHKHPPPPWTLPVWRHPQVCPPPPRWIRHCCYPHHYLAVCVRTYVRFSQ